MSYDGVAAGPDAPAGRVRTLIAVGLAVAVGVGTFAATAAIRGGGDAAPPVTDPPPTVDPAVSEVAPIVTEVEFEEIEALVVEPIGSGDDPETALPVEGDGEAPILSPAVGVGTIEVVDAGGDLVAAPAPYAGAFGAPPESVGELLSDEPPPEAEPDRAPVPSDVPAGVDVDGLIDELEEYGDGGPGAPSPAPGTSADDAPRLADPCADDPEPGVCPDPGEPGTVVGSFALTTPPRIRILIDIPAGVACPVDDLEPDEQRVAIRSDTPLTSFSMNYWQAGWPSTEPNLELSTPDDVAADWLDAFAAATDEPPPPILHCATIGGLVIGRRHQYSAAATDVFGQEWTTRGFTPPYFDGPDYRIPTTLVLPLTDNELLVSAPHRDDQSVMVYAFRRNGESVDAPVDPCASTSRTQPGFDLPWSPHNLHLSTTAPNRLSERGLDPAYVHRTFGTMRLDEGSRYVLCVYHSVERPSFSQGLERVEAFEVYTPDAPQLTFAVFDIDTIDDAPLRVESLRVQVAPVGRGIVIGHPWCGSWVNPRGVRGREIFSEVVCVADPKSSALYDRGARVTMTITDRDGGRHETSTILPIQSCGEPCVAPPSDWFRLELPSGRPQRDFWCGGLGDACDRPSDESYGTLTLEVAYDNPDGTQQADWSISMPREVGDSRLPPPETPRLDILQTPTASGTLSAQTITVPVIADRPVTVEAQLVTTAGGAPCQAEGASSTASSTTLAAEHTITFEGACPGQQYAVILELTAADGATSRWTPAPGEPGFGAGEWWGRGTVYTRYMNLSFGATMTLDVPSPAVRVNDATFTVGGSRFLWERFRRPEGWVLRGCDVPRGEPIVSPSRAEWNDPSRRIRVTEDLTIDFEFSLDLELLVPGCDPAVSEQPAPITLSGSIGFETLSLDTPLTIAQLVPVPELGPDASIEVSIELVWYGAVL